MARSANNLFSINDYAVAPPDYHRKAVWLSDSLTVRLLIITVATNDDELRQLEVSSVFTELTFLG